MKKKILIGILIVLILFTITGCGGSKNSEMNNIKNTSDNNEVVTIQGEKFYLKSDKDFGDLHYKENYVDFHTDQIGNMRTMSYSKNGNTVFGIRVMYDEDRLESELKAVLETQTGAKEQSKEINGIKYIYYEYTSNDNLTVHHYMHVHNSKVYSIGIFLGEDSGDIEKVFMNNVSFK